MILDVGSSSARAVLLDADLTPITLARQTYHFKYDPPGAAQADPTALRAHIEACIDAVLQHPAAQTIDAVGMTTFVGNVLGVDAHQQPVTPLYTYADTRAAPHLETLARQIDIDAAYQRTGCPHHVAYLPARLAWLADMQTDAHQWIDLATYCYRTWFRRDVPCSFSIASWSGLLDRVRLTWDAPWLDALGIPAEKLPALADYDAAQIGLAERYRQRWQALADVPFFLAVGDGVAANLGSGGVDVAHPVLTIGTTAAMRIVTDSAPQVVPAGLWNYRVDGQRHLIGGATTEGGNVFAWASDVLKLSPEAIRAALQNRRADQHGLTLLPTLAGERSPGYNPHATGTLHGITLNTDAFDIIQAVLEGVALRLAVIADRLGEQDQVVYGGGGALSASPLWAQICADALNRPLQLIDEAEVTVRGVGMLLTGDTSPPKLGQRYDPQPEAVARLQVARARQAALYSRLY